LPDADLFSTAWVRVPLPPNEFPGYKGTRATCDCCGEGINFDRFVDRDHQRLCLGCADPSVRYYQPI
jgi:formylmethanofuran dehydrogenase subunit E